MKKKLKGSLLGIIILVIGVSVFFAIFKNKKIHSIDHENIKTSVVKSSNKDIGKSNSIENSNSSKKDIGNVQNISASEKQKNIVEFKKEIIANGMYIKLNGNLELATDKNLKDIENKIKNPVILDMEKDGKMIKVISDSTEQAGELK